MKKIKGASVLAVAGSVLALTGTMLVPISAYAANVVDEPAFKAAIAAGEDVTLTGNITLTSPLIIPAAYTGTIDGSGFTVTADLDPSFTGMSRNGMFFIQGKPTFTNITVDGENKWRGFWVEPNGVLNLDSQTHVTNGRANISFGDGGAILLAENSKLNLNSAKISNSEGVEVSKNNGLGDGGGVMARAGSVITGTDCTFENNKTSASEYSNGGGIFIMRGKVNLDRCTFTGNSAVRVIDKGNQGAGIYATLSDVKVTNSTFNVGKLFNTGGAIRTLLGALYVDNSTFNIPDLGDSYGISGGAIAVESTHAQILNSTFNASGSSKVTFAGGFITVVGPNPQIPAGSAYPQGFTVKASTFTGSGSKWNGPGIATFGGGIAFEADNNLQNNYTALIEGSTFQNMAADENGGAITLTTRVGHSGGGVNLTLRDTTITNTRTRFAWANQAGGAIYNGFGNTLKIEGGSINGCFAPLGGGIFNDGTLVLDKGLAMDNNTTYKLGGAIYNNGALTVADATLRNNRHAEGKAFPGKSTPAEHVGGNIYAKKDVTITPAANIDSNDVRVLDKESAVVLTGALTKQLNVTISENALPNNTFYQSEPQVRKIGYLVAKGDGIYQPTASDAKMIHYLTNNTDPADFSDHTSVGKWDYVLTPNKTIVLGQRAKVVYDPNTGTFAGVTGNLVEDYVVFEPDRAYRIDTNTAVSKLPVTEQEPTRNGFAFRGWYIPAGPHAGLDNTVASEPAFVMPDFFGGDTFDGTSILDPNMITANAGWGKTWMVTYEFKSAQYDKALPADITQLLPPAKTDLAHGLDVPAVAATFPEVPVTGGKWVFTGWNADTAVKAIRGNHTFTGTWKFVKTIIPPVAKKPSLPMTGSFMATALGLAATFAAAGTIAVAMRRRNA